MKPPRLPQALRIATVVVFALVAALGVRLLFGGGNDSDTPEAVEQVAGSVSIEDAISGAVSSTDTIAVRGFLFDGGGTGVRLCPRRKPTRPPVCLGPFLDVYELDLHGLPWRSGEFLKRRVRWLEEPVTIYGKVLGSALTAESISR